MRFINQAGLLLVCAACWSVAAQADADAKEAGPREVVERAANQVIDVLVEEGEEISSNSESIHNLVNEHILPHFDFDRMSRSVLGNAWNAATAQQKAAFQNEFKRLLINTYAAALSEYSADEEIIYKEVIRSPKNENIAIVPTAIHQKGADPIRVAYRMFRAKGVWRIYDVVIDGASLTKSYRADFSGQMRGKSLDDLISILKARNKPA